MKSPKLLRFGRLRRAAKYVYRAARAEVRARKQQVSPIVDIPFASFDLTDTNPVATIVAAPVFLQTRAFFADNPAARRSLVSDASQALIFTLARNIAPEHVVEIGTFMGGTSEAIARALHANGRGVLHTVGPFDRSLFRPIRRRWPKPLRKRARFYAVDSMAFFAQIQKSNTKPSLVFVDGNHDYEFALFDITSAARCLRPGGFIVIDNVAQAGPYYAAIDFLAAQLPGWTNCAARVAAHDPNKAYDSGRTGVSDTDLIVLRAPPNYLVGSRPHNFGEVVLERPEVHGIKITLAATNAGTLYVECVLRGFNEVPNSAGDLQVERQASAVVTLDRTQEQIIAMFDTPLVLSGDFELCRAEIWLTFAAAGHLAPSDHLALSIVPQVI
jgi:predicted O-methyltransferase YrrM